MVENFDELLLICQAFFIKILFSIMTRTFVKVLCMFNLSKFFPVKLFVIRWIASYVYIFLTKVIREHSFMS